MPPRDTEFINNKPINHQYLYQLESMFTFILFLCVCYRVRLEFMCLRNSQRFTNSPTGRKHRTKERWDGSHTDTGERGEALWWCLTLALYTDML